MSCTHVSHQHKPAFDIGDIFRDNIDDLHNCDAEHWKVISALTSCKTARFGGYMFECDHCRHTTNSYDSCRNRHCARRRPKCQTQASAKWLEKRLEEPLPVEYFHVVFTSPDR